MELALALKPKPIAASALALALMPIAVAPVPGEAVAPEPHASSPLPAFCRQPAGGPGAMTDCAWAVRLPLTSKMPSAATRHNSKLRDMMLYLDFASMVAIRDRQNPRVYSCGRLDHALERVNRRACRD